MRFCLVVDKIVCLDIIKGQIVITKAFELMSLMVGIAGEAASGLAASCQDARLGGKASAFFPAVQFTLYWNVIFAELIAYAMP